jgi:hypothetical protein
MPLRYVDIASGMYCFEGMGFGGVVRKRLPVIGDEINI